MKKLLFVFCALATTTAQAKVTTEAVCSWAPSKSAIVNRIVSGVGGAGIGSEAILLAAGLTAVRHSAGQYIFTGGSGYVTGTFGGAAVAPWLITASVVVAGVVIPLELLCAPVNHPDAVKKVKEITAEFNSALRSANDKAVIIRDATGKQISEISGHAIDVRDGAIRTANGNAIEFRDNAARLFAKGWLKVSH